MKIFCVLVLWISTAQATERLAKQIFQCEWTVYKYQNERQYDNRKEDHWRRMIYKENRERILKNNLKYRKNDAPFKMIVNHLTDRLRSEIINSNGFLGISNSSTVPHKVTNVTRNKPSIDWRKLGAVTYVRDQGICGSCYAIATAQVIEGQMINYFKPVPPLSAQRFIDCSKDCKNYGCNGGLMVKAYQHVMMHGGLEEEIYYPYTGDEGPCKMKKNKFKVTVKSFVSLTPGSEAELEHALSYVGPVAVGIDAGQTSLASYSSGIYEDPKCSQTDVNHAVLVVGYGCENGKDYWIVKNSWGENWGEAGYVRIKKGCNHCGIARMPSYAKIDVCRHPQDVVTKETTTTTTTTMQPTTNAATESDDYFL